MDRLVIGCKMMFSCCNAKLTLLFFFCLSLASEAAGQHFPYTAYVGEQDTYVRSGPGQRYYPTGQLPQGFAVEVYRHDADGWCAIRPPEGSFSWVGSHQVRQIDADVVEIVEDNVVTRVGSTMSKSRTAVQVLLPKGERVQLLSAVEEEDPRWVRVAAPAGEFRWIAANDISRQPPIEAAPLPRPESNGWSRQIPPEATPEIIRPDSFDHLSSPSSAPSGLQFGSPAIANVAAAELTDLLPIDANADPNAMVVVSGSPADAQLTQFQAQTVPPKLLNQAAPAIPNSSITESSPRPRVRFEGKSSSNAGTIGNVEELELRLSQAVSQHPNLWELGTLDTAAKSLLANTTTPPVRAQLRDVIARIDRFQQVKRRYEDPGPTIIPDRGPFDQTPAPTQATATDNNGVEREMTGLSSRVRERIKADLDTEAPSPKVAGPPAKVTKPLFDAAGMLKPVVSQRPNAPEFALVDDQGKVVSFVTPTSELDIKQYVGRRIGVHGDRGYMPEYRRAHVTAGRVTPLSDTVRR